MIAQSGELVPSHSDRLIVPNGWRTNGRVLVVEDDEFVRQALAPILTQAGYQVSFAENGQEALRQLRSECLPSVILLDLRMPVMDGWEFRIVQQDDPKLALIPVVAVSADGSAQAAAISAQAYLRKPLGSKALLSTLERVLTEAESQRKGRVDDTERLASLGRLAANVGHEINNPLAFVMGNLVLSLQALDPSIKGSDLGPEELKIRLATVREMLQECQVGGERIRETVSNLQRLSQKGDEPRTTLDVRKLVEQSVSVAWNQIRHRACLVRTFDEIPPVLGNDVALGQVFLNLLINAAHAVPEGNAEGNQIRIAIRVQAGEKGAEVVTEIADSGAGMTPEMVARVFEPFFTTKSLGEGTGLGLSISRQTVLDHGGRLTVESEIGKGTVVRVFLPVAPSRTTEVANVPVPNGRPATRGRVLVVDDELALSRVLQRALKREHDVFVADRASEALGLLEEGQTFDLVLCDVLMPDMNGPQLYAAVEARWPALLKRLVFMTGGAFTRDTADFLERLVTPVLLKPFDIDALKDLIGKYVEQGKVASDAWLLTSPC